MKTKDFLYFVIGYLEGIKTSENISIRQILKLKMIIEWFKERENILGMTLNQKIMNNIITIQLKMTMIIIMTKI